MKGKEEFEGLSRLNNFNATDEKYQHMIPKSWLKSMKSILNGVRTLICNAGIIDGDSGLISNSY